MFTARPPIEALHIEFRSVRLGEDRYLEEFADFHPPAEYKTTYTGQRLREPEVLTRMQALRGICIEPSWSYDHPAVEGGAGGWMTQFWVPVPMHLFSRYEYRTFRLRAWVEFGGSQSPKMTAYAGAVDVSMESLKKERHMYGTAH